MRKWFDRARAEAEATGTMGKLTTESIRTMVGTLAPERLTGAELLRAQVAKGVCKDLDCNQPIHSSCDVCTKGVCRFHSVLVRAEDGTMRAVCAGTRHFASRMPLLQEITVLVAHIAAVDGDNTELAHGAYVTQIAIEEAALDKALGGTFVALDNALDNALHFLGVAASRPGTDYLERAVDLWQRADATSTLLTRAHEAEQRARPVA